MPNSPRAGTTTRSLRVEDWLWQRVVQRADSEGTTPSEITRQALERYCNDDRP